jgi:uncharacterized protein (DUF1499 family)
MKMVQRKVRAQFAVVPVLILQMACCVSFDSQAAQPTPAKSNAAAEQRRTALVCTVSYDCVNSLDSSGLPPLHFEGTPVQAHAALRATLAKFPEAKIFTSDDLSMEVVFRPAKGFRDLVDFSIDAQAQRIDFRSRSSFGRSDFGKNRSRMTAFSTEFEQIAKR